MAVTVLSKSTGVQYNMVSFNSGGEALTALLGGHVQASMGNPLEFMGQLQGGKVRALGVVRDTRFPACRTCRPSRNRASRRPTSRCGAASPSRRTRRMTARGVLGRRDDQGRRLRGDRRSTTRTTSRRRRRSPASSSTSSSPRRRSSTESSRQVKLVRGELVLALFFAALGGLWIARAARMPICGEGFAPDSGFLPLIYGMLLLGLALAAARQLLAAETVASSEEHPQAAHRALRPRRRGRRRCRSPASRSRCSCCCFFYLRGARAPAARRARRASPPPWRALLYLVFKTWLGVPLP